MILGIGTDILKMAKLEPVLSRPNYQQDSFIKRTYTPGEIALAESRPRPLYCYATRFAGKEAVFKALNLTGEDLRLSEIEILSHENGCPYVTLLGNAALLAQKRGITTVMISLSYEDDCAIAFAIASTDPSL